MPDDQPEVPAWLVYTRIIIAVLLLAALVVGILLHNSWLARAAVIPIAVIVVVRLARATTRRNPS